MFSVLEEGIQSRRGSPVGSEAPAGSTVTEMEGRNLRWRTQQVEGRMGHDWPCMTKGQLELLDIHRSTHRSTHGVRVNVCVCVVYA